MEGIPGHARSPLPYELLPGRNLEVNFPIQDLFEPLAEDNQGLLPRAVWLEDATGKKYIKQINKRDMNSWFETVIKIEQRDANS